MDSISQFTLGAGIGLALGGRKYGNKAARRGGFLGTLPDLDVFVGPLLYSNPIDVELFHRGLSHSFVFAIIAAPICGYLISKIHKNTDRKLRSLIAFGALATHPLLDLLTGYGTQILYPLSQYRFSVDSIFIVDPSYTIPLLIAFFIAIFNKSKSTKVRTITIGLIISTLYLIWSLLAQSFARDAFTNSIRAQNNQSELVEFGKASEEDMKLIRTSPTPFNTLLRRGLAQDMDNYYVSWYSLRDEMPDDHWQVIPKNHDLLDPYINHPDVIKLIHRRSPIAVEQINENTLRLNIVRYPKLLGRENFEDKSFMFHYTLTDLGDGNLEIGSRRDGDGEGPGFDKGFIGKMWKRIWGY